MEFNMIVDEAQAQIERMTREQVDSFALTLVRQYLPQISHDDQMKFIDGLTQFASGVTTIGID